jgi:hypothetical protein
MSSDSVPLPGQPDGLTQWKPPSPNRSPAKALAAPTIGKGSASMRWPACRRRRSADSTIGDVTMDGKNGLGSGVPRCWLRESGLSAAIVIFLFSCLATTLNAQELQPRAYLPAPIGVNFFGISYSHNSGGLLFDPSLPVEDAHVVANVGSLSIGQSLGVLGRSAQVLAIVPYVQADLTGLLAGSPQYRYRSGLGDMVFRYAMNIYGAPAMHLPEYAKYRQKTIVGASITVSAPIGQYDPNLLINIGTNRWGFKPEVGVSRALGKWVIEGAAGAWFYTANKNFYGGSIRTQIPLGSMQAHVVRTLPHRTWAAFDGTFFTGGRSTINGAEKSDYQGNARLGATFGMVITRRQSLRISYFDGVTARIGSDIRTLGIAYTFIVMRGR